MRSLEGESLVVQERILSGVRGEQGHYGRELGKDCWVPIISLQEEWKWTKEDRRHTCTQYSRRWRNKRETNDFLKKRKAEFVTFKFYLTSLCICGFCMSRVWVSLWSQTVGVWIPVLPLNVWPWAGWLNSLCFSLLNSSIRMMTEPTHWMVPRIMSVKYLLNIEYALAMMSSGLLSIPLLPSVSSIAFSLSEKQLQT